MLDIKFATVALPSEGALVLLIGEGEAATGVWQEADAATGGALARAFEVAGFKGGKSESCTVLAPGAGLRRAVAIGLGQARRGAGAGAGGRRVVAALGKETSAHVVATGLDGAAVALGAVLRAYRFDRYRTREKPEEKPKLAALTILVDDVAAAEAAWAVLKTTAEAVYLARDLVTEPAERAHPHRDGKAMRGPGGAGGWRWEVLKPADLAKLGFGALLAVAMGSDQEARVVIMRWNGGAPGAPPVAFIGKGVTFDSAASASSRRPAWRT